MPVIGQYVGVREIAAQIAERKYRTGEVNLNSGVVDPTLEVNAVHAARTAKAEAAKTATKAANFVKEQVKLD